MKRAIALALASTLLVAGAGGAAAQDAGYLQPYNSAASKDYVHAYNSTGNDRYVEASESGLDQSADPYDDRDPRHAARSGQEQWSEDYEDSEPEYAEDSRNAARERGSQRNRVAYDADDQAPPQERYYDERYASGGGYYYDGRCDGHRHSTAAPIIGGIIGGLIGNQFGSGDGRVAMTYAGAALGTAIAIDADNCHGGYGDRRAYVYPAYGRYRYPYPYAYPYAYPYGYGYYGYPRPYGYRHGYGYRGYPRYDYRRYDGYHRGHNGGRAYRGRGRY
jgi:hypothetical protein